MKNPIIPAYMEIGQIIKTFPQNMFIPCDGEYHHITALPYASLGYGIKGEFFTELLSVFELERLKYVKQLAFLRNPTISVTPSVDHVHFPHTRYLHSLDVGVLMGIFIKILSTQRTKRGVKEQMNFFDLLKTAIVAGFLHDILTPAGGDTMKSIDPMGFDEDLHFNEIFQQEKCRAFCLKHNIDMTLLYDIIRNKDFLGKLLNFADKLAYTPRDVFHYIKSAEAHETEAVLMQHIGFREIKKLVTDNADIAGFWRNIALIKTEPCFTGAGIVRKVGDFMKLRARMFRHIYYNEQAQFPERALAWFVMQKMYNTIITRENLLTMRDSDLEKHIDEYTGIPFFASHCLQMVTPQVKVFETEQDAQLFRTTLHASGTYVSFYEKFESRTKNGIKDFYIFHKNTLGTLHDFDEHTALDIEKTMYFPETHRVYFFNANELPIEYQEKIIQLQN